MKSFTKNGLISVMALMMLLATQLTAEASSTDPERAHDDGYIACPSETGELVTLDDIPDRNMGRKENKAKGATVNLQSKKVPMLVIVVGFNNMPYDDEYNWGSCQLRLGNWHRPF